jgi:ketosteroid isomerase-like protein
MDLTAIVREIYEAFGRGDVPFILSRLADDVDWEYVPGPAELPWLQRRRGREGAAAFFETLGAMEFTKFAPTAILQGDSLVVALVDVEFTVKATGRKVSEPDETHIFHFDAEGRVTRFRHRVDTHQQVAAIR